jgi:hypothetical protein
VAVRLNKKVRYFIDEHGTVGAGSLHLGGVLVFARDAGRVDKRFSDALEPNANEVRAVGLDDTYLNGLMARFRSVVPASTLVTINLQITPRRGNAPVVYAKVVIEVVKVGLKQFQSEVLGRDTIGIVDLIVDANHHNEHPAFNAEIALAQRLDGRFRAVNRIARLDSAASRLLQLADVVAYSRKWVANGACRTRGQASHVGYFLWVSDSRAPAALQG